MRIEKIIKKYDIKTNSKDILKNDIFVCALGNIDKKKYIDDAIKRGCKLVISDSVITKKIPCYKHDDINRYLVKILNYKYNYPLINKCLIGVTGTDGKTTTASIIRDMLKGASIGTNGVEYKDIKIDTLNTTPSLDSLYRYFNILNKEKINNIVMEVSSESYLTNRIPHLQFEVGLFLDISNEHLDKHQSFDNYLECKRTLLKNSKISIVNKDSKYFKKIVRDIDNYVTFGKKKSDLEIIHYRLSFDKTVIWLKYKKKKYKIISPLLGSYNVYNLCASILCLITLGYDMNDIIERIKLIKNVPGRMEKYLIKDKLVLIDYAHTENATLKVLKFLKKYSHKRIITVVGCAGRRYKEKRPLIGKYALKYSKIVFLTSDDYRDENPYKIVEEMLSKSKRKNYQIIINREEAILKALELAGKKDLVLLLGKGHDNYLAIGNEKIKYSDIEVLEKFNQNL